MKRSVSSRSATIPERGIALLITMFALLIISALALGLLISTSTESILAGNYRVSAQSYYAAYAGLEEARGRLWPNHPNKFGAFIPNPLPVGTVRYVLNPAIGETVAPTNPANAYFDTEYQTEWGVAVNSAGVTSQTVPSVSAAAGLQGPLFKWVRITPKTEAAGGIDLDNSGGPLNNATPLYYDGTQQFIQTAPVNASAPMRQVLRITSLAVMPSGAKSLLEEDVSQVTLGLSFPSALTFDGPGAVFSAPSSNPYHIIGTDNSPGGAACPALQPAKPAVGVVTAADVTIVSAAIPSNRKANYTGTGSTPSVSNVTSTLPTNEQSVTSLQAMLQSIQGVATDVVTGPASSVPNAGTAAAPTIEYVNGDLSLSGNVTGYGILVVTGNYSASGNVGWNGVVLVVGQGVMNVNGGGNNSYNGAVLVAKTLDAAGNPLATLGLPTVSWSGGGGNGIYFNSCTINSATTSLAFHLLSFSEVPQ
jgi:hypothetical protein